MLRVANSALYGFSGEIRSVHHATVTLGLDFVKALAIRGVADLHEISYEAPHSAPLLVAQHGVRAALPGTIDMAHKSNC